MNASTEMPRYQCHKKVWALKIASVIISPDGVVILPAEDGYAQFEAPAGWLERYGGGDNDRGFYVVYDDGYASWSPTKAFEDGYSRIGR